jgi:NADH-quinone oxidoreductase subunit L
MYFLVFHGEERFGKAHADHAKNAHNEDEEHGDDHDHHHGLAPGEKPHESPLVVTLPLILLAIPSVFIGFFTIEPMLFGEFFGNVIYVGANHTGLVEFASHFHGALAMGLHGFTTLPFMLAAAGVGLSYYFYMVNPRIPAWFHAKFKAVYALLDNKYYLDKLNEAVFARGARLLGSSLWNIGDRALIDGLVVNGSARVVGWLSSVIRHFQSGYIYHYAFVMILGVLFFLIYFMPFPSFAK